MPAIQPQCLQHWLPCFQELDDRRKFLEALSEKYTVSGIPEPGPMAELPPLPEEEAILVIQVVMHCISRDSQWAVACSASILSSQFLGNSARHCAVLVQNPAAASKPDGCHMRQCRPCVVGRQSCWTRGRAAAGCSGAPDSCDEPRSGSRLAACRNVCEEAIQLLQHGPSRRGSLSSSLSCASAPTAAQLAALVSAEVHCVMQANERGRQARDRARIMRTIKRQRQLEDRRARAGLVGASFPLLCACQSA